MARYSLLATQLKLGAAMAALMLGALLYSTAASANSAGGLEAATNQQRSEHGLAPLSDDSRLDSAASNKAADMITNNYWAHTSPTGVTPWYWITTAGYPYRYAGENLAAGLFSDGAVVTAWMNSPGHRANLLSTNFSNIGCASASGVFQGQQNEVTVCMYGATGVAPVAQPVRAPRTSQPASRPVTASTPVPEPTVQSVPSPVPPVVTKPAPVVVTVKPQGAVTPQPPNRNDIATFVAMLQAMAMPWANVVSPMSLVVFMAQ